MKSDLNTNQRFSAVTVHIAILNWSAPVKRKLLDFAMANWV